MTMMHAKSKKTQPRQQKAHIDAITAQLDAEWEADQSPLAAYMQTCGRMALNWVAGDPYNATFPPSFTNERLARCCEWLREQQGKPKGALEAARGQLLGQLRQIWPAYSSRCTGYHYGDGERPPELLEWEWEGLHGTHHGPEDEPPTFLPKFACTEAESFHLCALSLIFLNRSLKRKLCDLND